MLVAITREVSPSISQCELTHIPRQEINVEVARSQHLQYENVLRDLGCQVRRLSVEPNLPDSVFIEDTAIVLNELAIIARSGAASRREETRSVAEVLRGYRTIFQLTSPGTLDGGDVLQIGRTLFVGNTSRTNESGIKQLIDFISPYEYKVENVQVEGCLHLKSAVTLVGEETLLINRSWVDTRSLRAKEYIDIDPSEPYAANALLVGSELVYPTIFPKTLRRLKDRDISVRVVDVSELQKAEGAVTCCSLIFEEKWPDNSKQIT
ncbi:MAG: arginine deiminase family protein [Anaerolineales bacterium]